jgi:hypothetical protein
VQLAQPRPGLDAQLADQYGPGLPVGGQRVSLPPGPVQRQHQQLVQPLPERFSLTQLA